MNILVACEFSGRVRDAFRRRGHNAFSCDLEAAEDDSEYHLQDDVVQVMESFAWDAIIAFPPCTHLCASGARWFKHKQQQQREAIAFFLQFTRRDIPWAIENPVGIMSRNFRKCDQVIQPWQFGHGETKATCLWLNRLPKLVPTNVVEGRAHAVHEMKRGKDRARNRSRTYPGIADAMADQWSLVLHSVLAPHA